MVRKDQPLESPKLELGLGLIATEKEGVFYLQNLQCLSLLQRLFAVFTPDASRRVNAIVILESSAMRNRPS